MESLALSFQVVGPLFVMLAIGYILRRLNRLDASTISQMTGVAYQVFLSSTLFNSIYRYDLSVALDATLIKIVLAMNMACFFIAILFAHIITGDLPRRAALAQAMFQNSYVLYGVPIVSAIYGSGSIGMVAIMTLFTIPLRNVLAVVELSLICKQKTSARHLLLNILKNPLIVSSLIAICLVLLRLELPTTITESVSSLASAAAPISLILLGATFSFEGLRGYAKDLSLGVLAKLIVLPLILMPLPILLGVRGDALLSLLIMFAAPTASSAHILAQQMGADNILSGHMIVIGSAFSVISLFLWIFLLRFFSLI